MVVILAEGQRFFRVRTRWRRFGLFYLGFAVFCWSFTFVDVVKDFDQLNSVAAVLGLALRGFFLVLVGHLYGYVLLVPVIAFVNQLVFPLVPEVESKSAAQAERSDAFQR